VSGQLDLGSPQGLEEVVEQDLSGVLGGSFPGLHLSDSP
jgi:hypothetical protein